MAIKKFLMEGQKQVWPITRADCIYTVKGDELLSAVVDRIAQDLLAEVDRAKAAEKEIADELTKQKDAEQEGTLANKIAANAAAVAQEVQDRIAAVQGVQDQLDDLVGEGSGSVADQIDAAKQEMQDAVDGVVQDLADFEEAQGQKNDALDQKDGELAQAIADEKAAQALVNQGFEGRIAANEAFVEAHDHKPMEDRIAALEELHKEGGAVEEAIKKVADDLAAFEGEAAEKHQAQDEAIQAAQKAANDAQGEVDALEEVVGKAATETDPATGLQLKIAQNAKAVADEKARAEGQEAAIRQELANEKAALQAEIDADVKVEADRAVAEEGKIRGEFAAADAALKAELQGEIDADIAAESALRVAEEQRIEGLVTKEVEDRQAAVKAEEDARKLADQGLEGRIADIEREQPLQDQAIEAAQAAADQAQQEVDALEKVVGEKGDGEVQSTGVFKYIEEREAAINTAIGEAVDGMEGLVDGEKQRAEGQEAAIRTEFANADVALKAELQAEIDADVKVEKERAEGKEAELLAAINKEVGDREAAVNAEKEARENADGALDERLQLVEAMVGLESGDEQGNSLVDRVVANEAKLAGLEEDTVQAAINQAEADAKAHAEQKIAELVDSAPDAMNTLNELAKAINDNKDVYDGYVEQHAQAMAQMKTDLQKEIDDDVAAEAGLREAADTKLRQDFAAADTALHTTISAEIDADVKVEADRAKAAEQALEAKINSIFAAYDGDQEYPDLGPLA